MKNNRIVAMVLLSVWAITTVGCGLTSDLDDLKPTTDDVDTSSNEITDCEDAADCDDSTPYCVDATCVVCETTDQCDAGQWCDSSECVDCDDDRHCGASCTACEHPTRFCNDAGDACTECNSDNHCGSGNWCNAGTCEDCNTASHCGAECLACTDDTPACAADGNACVECAEHADCPGPIGACTPDNTCTCLAHDTDPKANCSADADCGDTDFACVQDLEDTDGDTDTEIHFACLRRCSTQVAMHNGLECGLRESNTQGTFTLAWAPATSCLAFTQHTEQLTCQQPLDCSVFVSYPVDDAECVSDVCTYPCTNSADCLPDEECLADICAMP